MYIPATGRPVSAALSSDGSYRVNLNPGEYTVVVQVGTEVPKGYREGDKLPPPKVVLPAEYTIPVKSKLKATVNAGQEQPIDFELK